MQNGSGRLASPEFDLNFGSGRVGSGHLLTSLVGRVGSGQ